MGCVAPRAPLDHLGASREIAYAVAYVCLTPSCASRQLPAICAGGICQHQRQRSLGKECGGGGICPSPHQRIRSQARSAGAEPAPKEPRQGVRGGRHLPAPAPKEPMPGVRVRGRSAGGRASASTSAWGADAKSGSGSCPLHTHTNTHTHKRRSGRRRSEREGASGRTSANARLAWTLYISS
jgi:hypothetical protein